MDKYIILRTDGHYSVLKEVKDRNLEYQVVIPNAGFNRDFVVILVDLLNSQGSEVDNMSGSDTNA